MLARRHTTILPAMTLAEAMETSRIQRVAGHTGDRCTPADLAADVKSTRTAHVDQQRATICPGETCPLP